MNFSDLFKQTGQLCEFSPNGKYMVSEINSKCRIEPNWLIALS